MISTRTSVLSLPLLVVLTACGGGGGDETTAATTGDSTGATPTSEPSTEPTGEPSTEPSTMPTSMPTSTGVEGECGDGISGPGELCDGDDLAGKSCVDIDPAFTGGVLACASDCSSFDTSGCAKDPNAALVVLNEVSAKGANDGPYAGLGDAIELFNAGGAPAQLAGWKLSDDPTFPIEKTYVFPPGAVVEPGAYLVLTAFDEVAATGDFPFGISTTKEETLTLSNAEGVMVDQLIVQGADAEVSYCRLPDGTGAWQRCDLTLAGTNVAASQTCGDGKIDGTEDCEGDDLGGETCMTYGFPGGTLVCSAVCELDSSGCESDSPVVINELESVEDNIEIYNSGNAAVDISGWILTDEADDKYDPGADMQKVVFPAMSTLAPKEYLVVAKGALVGQHPFGLGSDGDTVTLFDADLKPVSQVSYGNGQAAISYCRLPDGPTGTWQADCALTMGLANKAP